MGGEKFDSPQPESFLFGENSDLNFLGNKPVPFPYPPPQANEPTKTLKALINIRRDSLHFSKVKTEEGEDEPGKYNIVFTLDSDVRTSITIYYLATEEVNSVGPVFSPKREVMVSPTYMYRKGAGQQFIQPDHIFQPGLYDGEGLDWSVKELLPVVIHCVAEEGEEPRQSHVTIGVIDKHSDGTYALKTMKQKLYVDGLCYLLQEIYGVERKGEGEAIDEEIDDTGAECVVCMCDSRDTLILPCRHLCLCNACADSLRYQANNCPICRAPFRALLQIRALQKAGHSATHPALAAEAQTEGVPPGYELVSLVEALNGPFAPAPAAAAVAPINLTAETDGSKKKKTKRRGSKDQQHASKERRGGSDKSFSPPPVEELDPTSLPPAPPSPPTASIHSAGGDLTIIDEKERTHSSKWSRRPRSGEKSSSAGVEDCHKIKLEVTGSEVQVIDRDIVDEELARLHLNPDQQDDAIQPEPEIEEEEDEEDQKEPTTEDELLKDESGDKTDPRYEPVTEALYKPSSTEVLYGPSYVPDFAGSDQEEEEEEDDENVEIVSLRSTKFENTSMPGTPRSVSSVRSSQDSATSVNSSKQLLEKGDESAAAARVVEGGEGKSSEGKRKEEKKERSRRGKSSIAPQPTPEPC